MRCEVVGSSMPGASQDEAAWERLAAGGSVGGGGTFLSDEFRCPACAAKHAMVHNVLSGGTYAQERSQIQKYVCQGCGHAWRSD